MKNTRSFTITRCRKLFRFGHRCNGSAVAWFSLAVAMVLFSTIMPAMMPVRVSARMAAVPLITARIGEPAQQPGNAMIQGTVVRIGTNEPISGMEVTLTRVEGTASAPLTPAAPSASTLTPAQVGGLAARGGVIDPETLAAAIALARGGAQPGSAVTGPPVELLPRIKSLDDGTFSFRGLKPGKYTLVAVSGDGAYSTAEFGQRNPRGHGLVFPIAEGQTMKGIKLEMAPTGTISGRITDDKGEPLGHVRVMALDFRYQDGKRIMNFVGAANTDDRGNYRLFWLPSGQYTVAAKFENLQRNPVEFDVTPPGIAGSFQRASAPVITKRTLPTGERIEETVAIVYYGGVRDAERVQTIDLQPGATFAAADISTAAGKVATHHIRGVVMVAPTAAQLAANPSNTATTPVSGKWIRAIPVQPSPDFFVLEGTTDAKGAFDIAGAAPGAYTLMSDCPSGKTFLSVLVGATDLEDQKALCIAGAQYPGHVTIEGRSANDPDLAKIRIAFQPDFILGGANATNGVSSPPAIVAADGNFRYQGRRYNRVAIEGLPKNGYVKAIHVGTADLLEGDPRIIELGPMEIVIGTDAGTIEGVVVDDKQNALANTVVVLVPNSTTLRRRLDLYRNATTDAEGRFQLQAIPAGDYKLFAWEYADDGSWQNAEFLRDYDVFGKLIHVDAGTNPKISISVVQSRK